MTKTKTPEDYENELYEAETALASLEIVRSVPTEQLHAALDWLKENHENLSVDQADQLVDLVYSMQTYQPLEWHTKPEA